MQPYSVLNLESLREIDFRNEKINLKVGKLNLCKTF